MAFFRRLTNLLTLLTSVNKNAEKSIMITSYRIYLKHLKIYEHNDILYI